MILPASLKSQELKGTDFKIKVRKRTGGEQRRGRVP